MHSSDALNGDVVLEPLQDAGNVGRAPIGLHTHLLCQHLLRQRVHCAAVQSQCALHVARDRRERERDRERDRERERQRERDRERKRQREK